VNATFKGLRLGVARNIFFDLKFVKQQEITDAINSAIKRMACLGAEIQDPANLPTAEELASNPSSDIVASSLPSAPIVNSSQ
jgi:Asp-tRNA(Asn)/Glu-tRNA(Gln) amidotransferase A subunit family amidase